MKKSIRFLLILAFVALFAAAWMALAEDPIDVRITPEKSFDVEPTGYNVPTVSYMIAAPRLKSAPNWTLGATYSHGDIIRSTNNTSRLYWCASTNLTGVAATTCPNHHHGDASDGVLTWRRIPPHDRNGINVVNVGTNYVCLAVGDKNSAAEVEKGIHLAAGASWWVDIPTMQFAVFAISEAGTTNLVTVQEW